MSQQPKSNRIILRLSQSQQEAPTSPSLRTASDTSGRRHSTNREGYGDKMSRLEQQIEQLLKNVETIRERADEAQTQSEGLKKELRQLGNQVSNIAYEGALRSEQATMQRSIEAELHTIRERLEKVEEEGEMCLLSRTQVEELLRFRGQYEPLLVELEDARREDTLGTRKNAEVVEGVVVGESDSRTPDQSQGSARREQEHGPVRSSSTCSIYALKTAKHRPRSLSRRPEANTSRRRIPQFSKLVLLCRAVFRRCEKKAAHIDEQLARIDRRYNAWQREIIIEFLNGIHTPVSHWAQEQLVATFPHHVWLNRRKLWKRNLRIGFEGLAWRDVAYCLKELDWSWMN